MCVWVSSYFIKLTARTECAALDEEERWHGAKGTHSLRTTYMTRLPFYRGARARERRASQQSEALYRLSCFDDMHQYTTEYSIAACACQAVPFSMKASSSSGCKLVLTDTPLSNPSERCWTLSQYLVHYWLIANSINCTLNCMIHDWMENELIDSWLNCAFN